MKVSLVAVWTLSIVLKQLHERVTITIPYNFAGYKTSRKTLFDLIVTKEVLNTLVGSLRHNNNKSGVK